MEKPKRKISIVVPVYNEQGNIVALFNEIQTIFYDTLNSYLFEVVFVDDGSRDNSAEIVKDLATSHSEVRYITLSRNFGKEIALSAGLHHAVGDAIIIIDCDLQHPVKLIPEFIKAWERGVQIAIGVRTNHSGTGFVKRMGSYLFYKAFNFISANKTIPGTTDFRLLDRKVIDEFKRFGEHFRLTRSLIDWLGFNKEYFFFESPPRAHGDAQYSFLKLLELAVSGLVSNSLAPIKFAGYLGVVITFLFGLIGLYLLLGKYFFHEPFASSFTGTAQLAVLIIFLVGIMLSALGVMSIHIGNIYTEVINRPLYVVRDHNFPDVFSK